MVYPSGPRANADGRRESETVEQTPLHGVRQGLRPVEDLRRPGVAQLGVTEAAGAQAEGRHAGGPRRTCVPRRVTDHHPARAVDAAQCREEQVGRRLALLRVLGCGPGVCHRAPAEEVQEGLDVLRLPRARADDAQVTLLERLQEAAGAVERPHLADEPVELLDPLVAQGVAELGLDFATRDLGHELVASHADGAMDPPQRRVEIVSPERTGPGEGVVVVAVDEGSVDVEDDGVDHARDLPRWGTAAPGGSSGPRATGLRGPRPRER